MLGDEVRARPGQRAGVPGGEVARRCTWRGWQ
jgi:hypothetical protein